MRAIRSISKAASLALAVALMAGSLHAFAQQPASPSSPSSSPPAADATGQTPALSASPSAAATPPAPDRATVPADAGAHVTGPASASSQKSETVRRTDLPHDLSPWGMFMAADWVVKAVMIGLAFASLVTWTILLAKAVEIACAHARAKRAFETIIAADTLTDADQALANRGGPAAFMVRSADEELRKSVPALDIAGDGGVKERVVSRLVRIEARAGRRLTRGTGMLATIGATAPFVGLFGTVWGIMNSFIGISQAQTTNLAVVAPGIAEALLATALGLVAAIPAVVIYNVFARAITGYRQLLADAAAGVERLVSHDLDFRKLTAGNRAVATE